MKKQTPFRAAIEMTMDELLRKATAFTSFEDFINSVENFGYIPTIHCQGLRKVSGSYRHYQAAKNELAKRLIKGGFKIYTGHRSSYRGVATNY